MQISIYGSTEKIRVASDILARFLSPIVLTRSEIDAERARIKAEIRESGDRSSLVNFTNGIVHEGTTLSQSIIGSIKSVNSVTGAKLEEYRRSVFSAENLFVYVTGGVSDADISYLAARLAEYPVSSAQKRLNLAPVSNNFGNRAGDVYIKNDSFTMLRFTFDLDMSRVSVAETDLLFDVLLTGNNSHLFLELSERLGYCYDVGGNLERYSNIGTLSFYCELRESYIYDAVERTVEVLSRLKSTPLEERATMKATYVTNAKMLEDDVRELNFTMAYEGHVLGLGYSDISERAAIYSAATPDRLCDVAREIFRPECLTLTVKGNKRRIDRERLERIISRL
jgi:predicted Zn-dependent peptidase